jgi:tripartite-type tricarboxylate transporter receptor subunit TctC
MRGLPPRAAEENRMTVEGKTANHRTSRRRVCAALVAVAAAAAQDGFAQSAPDNYPSRPVRIVAPSAPGGGFDLVGRVLAQKLGEQTGQAFVVENRPGAGTLVGTQLVARAAPDGYSLVVGGLSNIALNMGLYKEPGYDSLADLTPVSLVVSHSYTLIARKDLPLASLKEVIDFARANPGKLNIGTSGPGTGQYIGAAIIAALSEVNMVKVPYKGAQPVYQDLLAGRVDLFYDNTTTARSYVESGQVKALAVSSRARAPNMPHVPTLIETGALDLEMETWFGLFAPARTPRAIVERLRAEVARATRSAEVRSRLEMGSGRSLSMAPAETEAFVRAEVARWTGLLRRAGITPE